MKKKDISIIAIVILVVIVIVAAVFYVNDYNNKKNIVFYVNDYPIFKQEIEIQAKKIKLQQREFFSNKSGQSLENLDFSKTVDGKTGYEYYADQVIKDIVNIKVLQIDAKKNGLYDNINYDDMMNEKDKINSKRNQDKLNDEVIYGVINYTDEQYYDYVNSNLYLQNERFLEKNNIITASEEELLNKYKQDPSKFDNNEYDNIKDFVKNVVITEKYEKYLKNLADKANVKNGENVAKEIEKIIK